MSPNTFTEIMVLIIAYLLGSIPSGLIISWIFKLADPRTKGSHSIGATNILRSGHKFAALLTLILDMLKGSVAVIIPLIMSPALAQLACIFVVLGHIWSLWLGFRGGKGVATALGGIIILSWPLAVTCIVSWIAIAATTRYSSLASILTVLLSPLYTAFLTGEKFVVTTLVLAFVIVWSHRKNIGRLLTGREAKIGDNSPPLPTSD